MVAEGAAALRARMGAEWVAAAAVPFQLALALAAALVLTAPARRCSTALLTWVR